MASTEEFRHESVQDRRSIVRYLQALTAGIEQGHVELGTADNMLALDPEGMLELQVRAKRKAGKVKLSVKLYWREHDDDDTDALEIKAGARS